MSHKLLFLTIALSQAAACGRARGPVPYRKEEPASESLAVVLPPGQAIYDTLCATCHAGSGIGQPHAVPPLTHSPYVTGDPTILVSIILHGLVGPVTVGGKSFNGVMPAWADSLTDPQVAAVATYVRRSWSNSAAGITAAAVAKTRSATAARRFPWNARELIPAPADAH